MTYTADQIQQVLQDKGELIIVLESGDEYELHTHDTTFCDGEIVTQGMQDSEYVFISFEPDRVEQFKWHKAL